MNNKIGIWLFAVLFLLAVAGCASFTVTREARFINMDNELLRVGYGEKPHVEEFGGIEFKLKGYVHLRLPDGKGVTCRQVVSLDGMRYVSKNGDYLYCEKVPYCILYYKGAQIFEGIYCREPKQKQRK